MKLGANKQHRTELEAALGRKYDYVRVYNVGEAQKADVPVIVSTKPGKWSDVAAGKADSAVKADAFKLAALARPGIYIMHHEPENDTASLGTAADFKAAFTHVIDVMRPLMPGWAFFCCYIGETFEGKNGGPDAWMPANCDGISIDKYDWCGARKDPVGYAKPGNPPESAATFWQPFVTFGTAKNKRMIVTEYGACKEQGENGSIQAAKIQRLADAWQDSPIEAILYFNSDNTDPGCITNNRVDGNGAGVEALKGFTDAPETDAEKIERLEKQVLTLEVALADSEAALTNSQYEVIRLGTELEDMTVERDALILRLADIHTRSA